MRAFTHFAIFLNGNSIFAYVIRRSERSRHNRSFRILERSARTAVWGGERRQPEEWTLRVSIRLFFSFPSLAAAKSIDRFDPGQSMPPPRTRMSEHPNGLIRRGLSHSLL